MRAKWLWVAAFAGVAAGCGEGHAIFNVDVYSFLAPKQDTIPYIIPPGTDSASNTPQHVSLPGAGSSIVDSVSALGTLAFHNDSGTATIGLQLFLAADSAGTYNSSALALTVPDTSVSGTGVTPDSITGKLNPALISLFGDTALWVRFQAKGSNAGLTTVTGKAVLTSLRLTVVITDKIF